jgi:hypothetical protein
MALNLVRAACVGIGVAFSAAAAATDFGSIMGLWDFVLPETIAGTGPQGASTATSPEDFDPSRPGLELLAVGVTTGCADPQTFRYRETRQFLATDGIPLVTFEVPQINATVPACPVLMQNRSSSAFAESGRTRVYVYTRALYVPGAALGTTGTWHM